MGKLQIILADCDPSQLHVGAQIAGGYVVEAKQIVEYVTAQQLADKYNISLSTVRTKLALINRGTSTQHRYIETEADALLQDKPKRGRARKN